MTDDGIEAKLMVLTGNEIGSLQSLQRTYAGLCPDAQATFRLILDDYLTHVHPQMRVNSQRAMQDALPIVESIVRFLNTYGPIEGTTAFSDEQEHTVRAFAHLVTHAMRTFPAGYLTSDSAQTIILEAFGTVGAISDVVATDYYIGAKAQDQRATRALTEFFEGVAFRPSVQDMRQTIHPVDLILEDWAAAVKYVHEQGVAPREAYLRDGTALFRFAPDCLPYVGRERANFPHLELLKVNDGRYVEQWLRGTRLSQDGRNQTTTRDNWLVMLTGYTPEDNRSIPGLYQRYNRALVSTAVSIGLERRM